MFSAKSQERNKKPTFLFIGPDKTGSTWIFTILREHPECFVPPAKDIWYFDRYYDRGMDWYLSFFEDASERAKAIGELSHNYLFSSKAANRISTDLPNIRLITCLRDPVKRTFSQYLYLRRSGISKLSFEEALEEHPRLIENSLYFKHLSTYFELFPRNQIKVLWFSDLKEDPEEFAKEIFKYLGLSFEPNIDYDNKVRPAGEPRSYYLAKLLKWSGLAVRKIGLANIVGYIKNSELVNKLFFRSYENQEKPEIDKEMEYFLREKFYDDIRSLEELLGVDLGSWLQAEDQNSAYGRNE